LLAAPLFVAAIFCKYTLIAAPAACFIQLLMQREWKDARNFAIANALLTTVAFAWVQNWTQYWFAFNMFWTHPDAFSFAHIVPLIRPALQTHALLIVMALTFVVRDFLKREYSLPALYMMLASFLALTAGKDGSVQNHLLEWMAVLCLCGGLFYDEIWEKASASMPNIIALALAFSILVSSPKLERVPANLSQCQEAYSFIKQHPGQKMLSENIGALVVGGKMVLISNPGVYRWLVNLSGWSDAALVEKVDSKYFDLIALSHELDYLLQNPHEAGWPPNVVRAMAANYKPVRRFACANAAVIMEPIGRVQSSSDRLQE
jgi:hypothetical protein